MTNVSRRAYGEGSLVYLKARDRWRGAFTDAQGKRRYAPEGKTRAIAAKHLRDAQQASEEGRLWGSGQQRLADYLTWWLAERVKGKVTPRSYHAYEGAVRVHFIPALGHYRLDRLSRQHVQHFVNELAPGRSPTTVKNIRAILRVALTAAQQLGLVRDNAATLIALPKRVRRPRTLWTVAEAVRFAEEVADDPQGPLYIVTMFTALRQGEALGLCWSDVRSTALTVNQSLQLEAGRPYLKEPKTPESQRPILLPARAIAALQIQRTRQLEARVALGPAWQNDWDLVFTQPDGSPLHGTQVTHQFQRTLERLGMPRLSFHGLRHLCATLLYEEGHLDGKRLQTLLGHSTIQTTSDLYIHTLASELPAAAMDAIFGGQR